MSNPLIIMAAVPETRSALPLPPAQSEPLRRLRERLAAATLRPEAEGVAEMHQELLPLADLLEAARRRAIRWVTSVRGHARSRPLAESLLDQFPLDSKQGKALMSLAEALLRTPDRHCADRLIAERLSALREGGAKGSDLTVRLSMALLGTAGRLLPDAERVACGKCRPLAHHPRHGTARARRAAAWDANDGPRIHRRGIHRLGARARPARP